MIRVLNKTILPLLCLFLLAVLPTITALALESSALTENSFAPEASAATAVEPEPSQAMGETPTTEVPPAQEPPAKGIPLEPNIESDLSEPSYGVTIFWPTGGPEFAFTKRWDPNTHRYDGWKSNTNYFTVTNESTEGVTLLVVLSFQTDANAAMRFSPDETETDLRDFREAGDGQIAFSLPRANGDNSIDIYLWPSPDWNAEDGAGYQQMGMIRTSITVDETVESLDQSVWQELPVVEPPEPEPEPEPTESLPTASSEQLESVPELTVDSTPESTVQSPVESTEAPAAESSEQPDVERTDQPPDVTEPTTTVHMPEFVELPPGVLEKPPEETAQQPAKSEAVGKAGRPHINGSNTPKK